MKTVIGIGEVLWDQYHDFRAVGGAPANAALHAGQLGAHSIVVSAVGNDEEGAALVSQIQELGGDVRFVQRNDRYQTGVVKVMLDSSGVPSFQCSHDAAFDHLVWKNELSGLANNCDAVVTGTLAQRHPDSGRVIQRFLDEASSALKVFDVNFRKWHEHMETVIRETLEKIHIIKMNREEMDQLRLSFNQESLDESSFLHWLIREYSLKMAVLTLGSEGCMITDDRHSAEIAGLPVHAIDTTGCGDAFTAGFIIRILEGASLEEAGQSANAAGAFTASHRGAVPPYSIDDILNFERRIGSGILDTSSGRNRS
jgi:fructokinase